VHSGWDCVKNSLMGTALDSQDIRALLRLLAELRELGSDPDAWRKHLAQRLEVLCATPVSLVIELRRNDVTPEVDDKPSCADFVTAVHSVAHGLDTSSLERFYREVYYIDHRTDDALFGVVPLYGTAFTVQRGDVITDRKWNRSFSANERFRANGIDDFVLSMVPVPELNVISSMELYRSPGRRFSERERLFVALLHEELANDWQTSLTRGEVRLTPRQAQVLARLAEGASEKEIAYDLGLSAHTTHDHVKALHRAFGARSRGELLARSRKPEVARTQLLATTLPRPRAS
jgi:DNA-binding CsgD family transcriptional regulator